MAVAMIASSRLPLEAQNTRITGVSKNAAGEPVAGALVKIRSEDLGLGFMVVSQAQGQYVTPNLLPGKYTVQGFGGGYQSAPAGPVEVRSGQQGKMDLVLSAPLRLPPREKRMTDDDYDKLMPEGEQARVKESLVNRCKLCHSVAWIVSARKTPEKWAETVDRMRDKLLGIRQFLVLNYLEEVVLDGLMKQYLAKNYGPDTPLDPRITAQMLLNPESPPHPNRNLPAALLKGAAAKYVAMEFSLPPGSAPHDISVDSQGIAWISERTTGMLGRFDPNSLTYTRIASPPGKTSKFQLNAIAVDPQDQVWFVDDGPNARILQYNPKTQGFNSYPIPEYRYPVPDTGWARIATLRFLDGNVWATGMTTDRILKLDPSTRKVADYSLPKGMVPYGMAIDGNKMVWYSAEVDNAVVRLDPRTGPRTYRITPYDMPTERSDLRGMAADAEGNLWVAALESGKLVKVDNRTGRVTEYAPPTEDSGPYAVDGDTKRNLVWFSEVFSDRIARFDPSNNSFVEFPHPSADSDVQRIEVDRNHPNRLWWSGTRGDKIGYIEVVE